MAKVYRCLWSILWIIDMLFYSKYNKATFWIRTSNFILNDPITRWSDLKSRTKELPKWASLAYTRWAIWNLEFESTIKKNVWIFFQKYGYIRKIGPFYLRMKHSIIQMTATAGLTVPHLINPIFQCIFDCFWCQLAALELWFDPVGLFFVGSR